MGDQSLSQATWCASAAMQSADRGSAAVGRHDVGRRGASSGSQLDSDASSFAGRARDRPHPGSTDVHDHSLGRAGRGSCTRCRRNRDSPASPRGRCWRGLDLHLALCDGPRRDTRLTATWTTKVRDTARAFTPQSRTRETTSPLPGSPLSSARRRWRGSAPRTPLSARVKASSLGE